MGKRFGRLKFALDMITGTDGKPDIPSDAPIKKYAEYAARTARRGSGDEVNQPPRLGYVRIAIAPFGFPGTEKQLVKVTKRTFDKISGSSANLGGKATYNWIDQEEGAVKNGLYTSAAAIVTMINGTEMEEKTSFFTGFKYKAPRSDDSYTIPFGEAATTPKREIETQDAIISKLEEETTATIRYVYTFRNEKLSRAE